RQFAAALGLTGLAGQAQMVRPVIAPMVEAAAETQKGSLSDMERECIRAQAGAADNIALLFGEGIFLAIGSILLMRWFLQQNGILVEPLQLSVWAIPTAVAAFLVHAVRLYVFERRLVRNMRSKPSAEGRG